MNSTQSSENPPVRALRGETLLRGMNSVLPLGRLYAPLFGLLNSSHHLVAIPFEKSHVVYPAMWRKSSVTQLLMGLDHIPEFRLLAPICGGIKRGRLVDVGANVGLYTLLLRSLSPLPIVAYEPQPFLCQLVRWTLDYNHMKDVTLRHVGCGAERGEVPFHTGANGGVLNITGAELAALPRADSSGGVDWETAAHATVEQRPVVRVPVVTLDEDLTDGEPVALLKIDCEGFELNVLRGAPRIIERDNPWLFLEIHPTLLPAFGQTVEEVLALVRPHYEMEFWCFQSAHGQSKLARSLSKFRKPQGRRYADETEMLAAVNSGQPPSQVYCIGRPKHRAY